MKVRSIAIAAAALVLVAGGRLVLGQRAQSMPGRSAVPSADRAGDWSILARAGLPTGETAQEVLATSLRIHHHEWVDVPEGTKTIDAFVVYPHRSDAAPVALITAKNYGMSDWLRAIADQVAIEGFIGVVPESMSPSVRDYAAALPGSNGTIVTLGFEFAAGRGRLDAVVDSRTAEKRVASFELTEHAWHDTVGFLAQYADAAPSVAETAAQQRGRGERGEQGGCTGNMQQKCDGLPANFLMAATTVGHSPRRGEWVDVPMGATRIRTWITYPQGTGSAPIIVVIQPGPGMDMGEPPTPGGGANWLRGIADQMAIEGFIALVPDFTSGLGPNGGNFDSFKYPDEVARALRRRTQAEQIDLMRTVRDYGLKLPRANGRSATIGFCFGGGMSWIAAAELAGLNAAVVFYGGPPNEAIMSRIHAPVLAFFGENDLGLAPQIAPATASMKRLGKSFDVHVYPKATHVFLYRQDLGENFAATEDSWPKAIAFLKQHTKVGS